ncbi:MAG: hypothetical protein PHH48_01910 [Eubacteriales bacterium]|nr:hypothetical protein [Eubacteriales bacterium]
MKLSWFKNPDNVVYAPVDEFADNFGKEVGINNLRAELEAFKNNPEPKGKSLQGTKRVTLKLLIPNLYFDEKIDMGDSVWVYIGENYESYCVYWPQ